MTSKCDKHDAASEISASRREFLGRTARAGLLAFGGPVLAASHATHAYGAVGSRSPTYAVGGYALELGGAFVGFLRGFSGGEVTADVVMERLGPDHVQQKRLGQRRVEPITIETGLPMAGPFYNWVKSGIEPGGNMQPMSGAILEYDNSYIVRVRRSFSNGRIAKVEFPSGDLSSKEPARLAVTYYPESVGLAFGDGAAVPATAMKTMASWIRANYNLQVEGLERPSSRAIKIEPIVITRMAPADAVGRSALRQTQEIPPAIGVANLRVTVGNIEIQPFYAWHNDFVVAGSGRELRGILEYRSTVGSVLLRLNFFGLGIIKVSPVSLAPGQVDLPSSIVEMYCEAVTCDFSV